MKDPERIGRITDKLQWVWESVPDWRLGQLLSNVYQRAGDLFYVEDEEWEQLLDDILETATFD